MEDMDFITIAGAWKSLSKYILGENPELTQQQIEGAQVIFLAGCRGVLIALSNIKDKIQNDPVAATQLISDLYVEADRLNRSQEERDAILNEVKPNQAWPFPTGTRQ